MENKGIFRQQSLDRLASPEQMNDYIRVTNPGVFLLLLVIILLLCGLIAWAVFGELETTLGGVLVSGEGQAVLYVPEEVMTGVRPGMRVRSGAYEGVITGVAKQPVPAAGSMDAYALHVSGWTEDEWVMEAAMDSAPEDGVYPAEVVTDSVKPMTFVVN